MEKAIYTIGHSTRSIGEFLDILDSFGIRQLVDVRTVPRSRNNPQFWRDMLSQSLERAGIRYFHLEKLGWLRHAKKDSQNLGWRNASFRGYADYMQTDEFWEGLQELIDLSSAGLTVIMCAEAVPWRCHRSLIADALLLKWIQAMHIMAKWKANPHKMIPFAKVVGERVTYPGEGDVHAQ